MSLVSLVKISREAEFPFKQAIMESVNLIGYKFSSSVRRVVIKPNLCYYWDATTGQTTSPRFVSELIDLLREQINPNIEVAIVESDASAMRCKYAFRMLGYTRLAKEKNVRLINLTDEPCIETDIPCNGNLYSFKIPKIITEADLKINIAHIKYMVEPIKLTCVMKNIFGCNPTPKKFRYHKDIANVIVALNKAMPFDLCLIDCNIAAGVQPRRMGLVMASTDPVAIDTAAAKIAGLNPNDISYIRKAEQEGVGSRRYAVKGEPLEVFRVLYPKYTLKMKAKRRVKKTLITVGLGRRLGLE